MSAGTIASLALHSLAATADVVGLDAVGKLVLGVGRVVGDRFGDNSRRLLDAVNAANVRAWSALEIALAEDGVRRFLSAAASRADDRILAGQLRTFLAVVSGDASGDAAAIKRKALAELRHARAAGLLTPAASANDLAAAAEPLARFADADGLVRAAQADLDGMAANLHRAGYEFLARVVTLRPDGSPPLYLLAVRYFLRRSLESDEELFRGLAIDRLGKIQEVQQAGFAALELALDLQGERLAAMVAEAHETAAATHDAVMGLHGVAAGQSEQLRQIATAVGHLLEQHRLQKREVRPGDSLSVRGDEERLLVRQLVGRYRALPEDERRRVPGLLNGIGKLQVVAGDFDDAQDAFRRVAALEPDAVLRAEAHHNAYRAALERRDWPSALEDFTEAVRRDPRRFTPFPEVYQPQRILGAGGFGVAFLCRHRYMNAPVVVKALWLGGVAQESDRVFGEARLLRELDHPAVIRLTECGYADPERRERPFLVMDYFEGSTLEEHLDANATVSVDDYLALAPRVAGGLLAAHRRGILHRDIKPANILLRRDPDGWQVKLIDFGLAVRHDPATAALGSTTRSAKTLLGTSIAGTLAYAAPEQVGLSGEPVGPPADVYAFARTSCRALFGTTQPLPRHWQRLPSRLAELLGQCLEDKPSARPANFEEVLARLAPAKSAVVPVVLPAVPDALPVLEVVMPVPPVPEVVVREKTQPVGTAREQADLDTITSLVELLRLTRRMLKFNLFEIAGSPNYPHVARSDMGGFEMPRPNLRDADRVHPMREFSRIASDLDRRGLMLDPRLTTQMRETTEQARKRLTTPSASLLATGNTAAGLMVASPLFGVMIALSQVATAPFVVGIILCALSGAGAMVLTILTLVQIGHMPKRRGLCREVIEHLEPLQGGERPGAPQVWPSGEQGKRYLGVFFASLGSAIGVLCLLTAIAQSPQRPKPPTTLPKNGQAEKAPTSPAGEMKKK